MFAKYWLRTCIAALILALVGAKYEGYRFKLDIGNPNKLCPQDNYKCSDGNKHYLCEVGGGQKHAKCVCHKQVDLSEYVVKIFLEATNGIRNKFAADIGIANMNLVYWSDELKEMANAFLRQCNRTIDTCLLVGEKQIKVSQNTMFFQGELVERWPGRVVRRWYYEVSKNVTTFANFEAKQQTGEIANLTKLVYPLVEFMGCGSARWSTGYYIICYYHPPPDEKNFRSGYTLGKPNVNACIADRGMQSKTFTNLCGIDFDPQTQGSFSCNENIFLITSLIILNLFYVFYLP